MAKTKAGNGRPKNHNNNNNYKNNNNDRNKKNLENGLYVHSSPPKAFNSNNGQGSASIRDYIRAADIEALEEVVLQGQGTKLVNQHATDQRVRNFLRTVPSYMSKIDLLHDAVEKGNLRDLKALLDRRKLARSKDAQGVGLLHKAVVHDHRAIVDYLISDFPETLEVTDNDGRTALHYCAASAFPEDMYAVLCDAVSDAQVEDDKGKTAADYMSNPRELNVSKRSNKKSSGGSKGKKRTPPKRNSPGDKIRTPPKREGMNITGANIRIWIHDKDLTRLEQIVWEGQGHRLLKETSNSAKVRQFLNLVPRMMTKIKEVHQAAVNGNLETLDAKVDQPDILIAKDQNGLNPLHKSAAQGHKKVSEWIVQKNQSTMFAPDRKGRTPLFYAGIAKDGGEVYDMFLRSGADAGHTDQYRKTAEHYRFKPNELDLSVVYDTPLAPRGGGGTLDIPGTLGGHSKQNSRAPSRNNPGSRNPSRRNSLNDEKRRNGRNNGRKPNGSGKSGMEFRDMKNVTDADIEKFIREGDVDSLEYIILSGRGPDLQGKSSWNEEVRRFLKRVPGYMEKITSLHDASASGNMTNVRRLTKENEKLAMARNRDGGVALHYAARSGNPKVTKYLIGLYPDAVNLEDNEGRTPMHYAAMSGGPEAQEVLDLLQSEGANADATDLNGNTPEDYRQSSGGDFLDVDNNNDRRGRNNDRQSREKKKGPARGPSKDKSREPSRGPSRNDKSRGSSRDRSKGPSRNGKSRGQSREPSRGPSRDGYSRGPSRNGDRSRGGSRAPSPHATFASTTNDIEVIAAIAAAEKNEDYKPLNEIIVRGDGEKLLGQTSKDSEVNDYLKRIPDHLDAIEELHKAVEEGETRKVKQLVDKRKKAQTRDRNQANILHKAVLHGHSDLVRYMISSFPELMKQEDRAGRTPMHYAAVVRDGGHIYKIMEREGGDEKTKDYSGHTPEDYKNDPQILTQWDLKRQLEEGLDTPGGDDARSRPLTKGSEASPKSKSTNKLPDRHRGRLSRRGSRSSAKSEFPGMWSEEGSYLTEVLGDVLIRGLSEVNEARPKDPISYLACCLYNYRYTDKPDTPNNKNDSNNIGSSGSGSSGHSTIAMQTALNNTGGLDESATPQTRDKCGQNVLHFAASRPHGRSAFYRLVGESKCNLADRDEKYRTPRDVASENDLQENVRAIDKWVINLAAEGRREELQKLLVDGYDHLVDVDDDQGNNVLEVAQSKGQDKTVEFLRSVAGFEEKRDWLHKAIRVGSLPHVQYIADSENIAVAKDHHGRTSLHIATLCEEKEIMEFLATQYPVLLKIGDNLERTPLHYAMAVEGVDQVAKVLVQAGARRVIKDLRGKQPSYYFMNRGEIVDMIKVLRAEDD